MYLPQRMCGLLAPDCKRVSNKGGAFAFVGGCTMPSTKVKRGGKAEDKGIINN